MSKAVGGEKENVQLGTRSMRENRVRSERSAKNNAKKNAAPKRYPGE